MTKKWLEDNNIYYDNLILTDAYDKCAKTKQCLKHNIDIMIDDSVQFLFHLLCSLKISDEAMLANIALR